MRDIELASETIAGHTDRSPGDDLVQTVVRLLVAVVGQDFCCSC